MAPDKVQQVIEKQLGKPPDEVFACIDLANPLASASMAQGLGLKFHDALHSVMEIRTSVRSTAIMIHFYGVSHENSRE
ncbi:hypothetical protein ABBQ32_002951 [Trebouxia sp. C0010 RCD-2024]